MSRARSSDPLLETSRTPQDIFLSRSHQSTLAAERKNKVHRGARIFRPGYGVRVDYGVDQCIRTCDSRKAAIGVAAAEHSKDPFEEPREN